MSAAERKAAADAWRQAHCAPAAPVTWTPWEPDQPVKGVRYIDGKRVPFGDPDPGELPEGAPAPASRP